MHVLASGFIDRARLLEWHGDPAHRASCVGSQKLPARRSPSYHARNKINLTPKNHFRLYVNNAYCSFLIALSAIEAFGGLHTVAQESPCCHSVVFEALGERNCLHLCFFTKFPFSIYFLRHFDLKAMLYPLTNCQYRSFARRQGIFHFPHESWFNERKKESLY